MLSIFQETLTPQIRTDDPSMTIDDFYDQRSQNIPLGRLEEANESGDVIWFLTSYHSSYLTRPSINIDGGTSEAIEMSQLYIGSFLCLQK